MSGCGTWPTSILKRSISVLWDKADVPGPLADPSMTQGDIWRDVLRLTAQTSARREEHYAVLFGHSLLDNITPKGDRQCLKHIGLKGFQALFVIKMPTAFRWLEEAFGFEPLFVLLDAEGNLGHSEMTYGNSVVMVGNEWSDANKSPKSIGGKNSESIHVQLAEGEDLDAHCERARAAGAEVLMEPEMQFYGDRTYRARDPEGHI